MIHSGLFFVVVAAVLAPLLSLLTRRTVPSVVFEIGLGILIGPAVLALASPLGFVAQLGELGLAMLMFLAGTEVNTRLMRGAVLHRAVATWVISLLVAAVLAVLLVVVGYGSAALYLVLPVTSTALGTLLPILHSSRLLATPLGPHVLAIGTVGEFGPIVLVALLLGDDGPLAVVLFLLGFLAIVAAGMWLASSRRMPRLRRAVASGLHDSSQLPIRASMLVIVFFTVVAEDLGIDMLLGAFCAGLIVRGAAAMDQRTRDVDVFRGKLEAVGFGVLVPIFFVTSGMKIDIGSIVENPASLAVVPLTVGALWLCRGVPTLLVYRGVVEDNARRTLAFFAATALPLVVVITGMGVERKVLEPEIAAAVVAGALVTVLLMPMAGLQRLRRSVHTYAS